jgi:hypothetical protein
VCCCAVRCPGSCHPRKKIIRTGAIIYICLHADIVIDKVCGKAILNSQGTYKGIQKQLNHRTYANIQLSDSVTKRRTEIWTYRATERYCLKQNLFFMLILLLLTPCRSCTVADVPKDHTEFIVSLFTNAVSTEEITIW